MPAPSASISASTCFLVLGLWLTACAGPVSAQSAPSEGQKIAFDASITLETAVPTTVFGPAPNYWTQRVRSWEMGRQNLSWKFFKALFSMNGQRTIKGVADRTVARIMAEMPEIGTLSNKTVSKLAGLAPLANDSGKHQGKRAVRGGCATVRDILFLVGTAWSLVTSPTSSPSSSVCAPPANHPKSCVSPWPTNCSSVSMPKPARFANRA